DRSRCVGVARHEEAPGQAGEDRAESPDDSFTRAQPPDRHLAGLASRLHPIDPAIDLDEEEEDLEQGVAVEPRPEENEEIEGDHDEPEWIIPDAAAHDQG